MFLHKGLGPGRKVFSDLMKEKIFFFFFHPFSFPLSMNLFIYFRGPFFGIFHGIRIVEIHEFVECAISAPELCYQMASNVIN